MTINSFIERYQKERRHTQSLKWDALDKRFGNAELLPLWVADMEFQAPEVVVQELFERVSHGVFGYSLPHKAYFLAFSNWQKKRHNIDLKEEWLRYSNGVVQSLYHLIQCFSNEGDGVLIQPPVYYPFFNAVKDTNRKLVLSPLINDNGAYSVDLTALEEVLKKEQPKLFILCSPHNPVGRIWKESELEGMLALCERYDVIVIADEIHQDFEFSAHPFKSVLSIEEERFHNRLIVCNAPSKSFNLASLLHSHIIIPDQELREQFDQKMIRYQQTEVNLLGQVAGEAAYRGGEEWFDSLLTVIRSNDLLVREALAEFPQLIVSDLEGTYLLWIDLRAIIPKAKVKDIVQEKAKLAVDYGEWFSEDYLGFIRLNLATTPDRITLALEQLTNAIRTFKEENK